MPLNKNFEFQLQILKNQFPGSIFLRLTELPLAHKKVFFKNDLQNYLYQINSFIKILKIFT